MCWSIWKARNKLVLNKKKTTTTGVFVSVKLILTQWKSAQPCDISSSMGFLTPLDGREHWEKPSGIRIKINVDETIFEDSGKFGFGGVAQNSEGSLVAVISRCKVCRVSPEIAEAIGVREVLSWVKTHTWTEFNLVLV